MTCRNNETFIVESMVVNMWERHIMSVDCDFHKFSTSGM